ncbi:DUF2332 domain-containing protein [Saccharopolyspora taberi]|uniref:DUF2332 domain-containing protein n=1 Tax=Saccharopolyspora taberi TaxID=60895 RepID=UPI0031E1F4DF
MTQQIRERYERFARTEAHGTSAVYEDLAMAVSRDEPALAMLARLPAAKRQPNLLFGVLRLHGVPVDRPADALAWMHENEPLVLDEMRARRTQTNEVARCAVLLPALAAIEGPLAVVEAGASAGLCLLFDAWRYHYVGDGIDHHVGPADADLTLTCSVEGPVPLPERIPEVGWRAGLDLNPLDPGDADNRRWLECLIWPEHDHRVRDLRSALATAQRVRPRVEPGDILGDLPDLVRQAPDGLTPVVIHSATLAYLGKRDRERFREQVRALGAHRIGLDSANAFPEVAEQLPADVNPGRHYAITLDDRLLGYAEGHGGSLSWLPDRA